MRDVARALLIAATLLLLSYPARFGAAPADFAVATVLLIAANGLLLTMFAPRLPNLEASSARIAAALVASAMAALLILVVAHTWLHEILIYPNDPWRADMLVVIQEGIRRMLRGENPYTMYHVPWDATLPYGPVMWAPYVIPYLMGIDVRFVSLLGALCAPLACGLTAAACAGRGRYTAALASLLMLAALAVSADLRGFASIAHTPSYWPGLALLAWLVARDRWNAAAIACGLLIVARTTMAATAPVLIMAVWYHDRRRVYIAAALLLTTTILPYLGFALWDAAALKYALYGSYQALMKGFVWTSTTWAHDTIGVTGLLLRRGLQRYAEAVQSAVMVLVYVCAWRSIRGGAPALPWMAFALFAFSATTLWPVSYVYFDVTLLWIAAALADGDWIQPRRVVPAWTVTVTASAAILVLVALVDMRRDPVIDVGIGACRSLLYKGFSNNEGTERTFAWIDGTSADVLIPRRSRADAEVELVIEPYLPNAESRQQLSVSLNGIVLGVSDLEPGWHTIAFPAPSRAWRIGVNELHLSLSTAVSPREAQNGDDTRRLSAAIDRLTIRTTL